LAWDADSKNDTASPVPRTTMGPSSSFCKANPNQDHRCRLPFLSSSSFFLPALSGFPISWHTGVTRLAVFKTSRPIKSRSSTDLRESVLRGDCGKQPLLDTRPMIRTRPSLGNCICCTHTHISLSRLFWSRCICKMQKRSSSAHVERNQSLSPCFPQKRSKKGSIV